MRAVNEATGGGIKTELEKRAAMLHAKGRCVNCYSKVCKNMIRLFPSLLADKKAREEEIRTTAMLQAKGRCVKC